MALRRRPKWFNPKRRPRTCVALAVKAVWTNPWDFNPLRAVRIGEASHPGPPNESELAKALLGALNEFQEGSATAALQTASPGPLKQPEKGW